MRLKGGHIVVVLPSSALTPGPASLQGNRNVATPYRQRPRQDPARPSAGLLVRAVTRLSLTTRARCSRSETALCNWRPACGPRLNRSQVHPSQITPLPGAGGRGGSCRCGLHAADRVKVLQAMGKVGAPRYHRSPAPEAHGFIALEQVEGQKGRLSSVGGIWRLGELPHPARGLTGGPIASSADGGLRGTSTGASSRALEPSSAPPAEAE